MPFEPDKINKEHVLAAVEKIDKESLDLISSTRWDVIINGKAYPPKEIMRYAHQQMNGNKAWIFSGGEQTNKYLKDMGFEIVEKSDQVDKTNQSVQEEIIEFYKELVREDENENELYKWRLIRVFQEKWDIEAEDFTEMLQGINFSNLLDYRSTTLIRYADDYPEEARELFKLLYNEEFDLKERIQEFGRRAEELVRKHYPDKGAFQDERTLATYLTFRYPDTYSFYKYSFYSVFADLLKADIPGAGDRYIHYLSLVDKFIKNYISQDEELVRSSRDTLTDDCYVDENLNILAQDILFRVIEENNYPGGSEDDVKDILDAIGYEAASNYFNVIDTLSHNLGLAKDDQRVVYSFRKNEKRMVFTIGQRYSFIYEARKGGFWGFIHPNKKSRAGEFEVFSGPPEAYWHETEHFSHVQEELEAIREACQAELEKTNRSGYSKYNNQYFEKAVFDPKYRKQLFRDVFDREPETSPEASLKKNRSVSKAYAIENALEEIFIDQDELQNILNLLNYKKNIILQGPPGTGKTFLAQRLAWLMMNVKDRSRIEMVQFHPSYSYEDFIRGYRPTENHFELKDGIFMEMCNKAKSDPDNSYFLIIDEINRGNLSKIFGELMMLIEKDKRGKDFTVSLPYQKSSYEPDFYIPENLYLIGTMNTADRSLAMVDYALRRRFVFIDMIPNFGENFQEHLQNQGVEDHLINIIVERLEKLNEKISKETGLGDDFQIGHSYFCHTRNGDEEWFKNIIRYEILPLLREYWFDKKNKVDEIKEELLTL